MQLVVVIAVRNAVSAATITFTAVSRKSFLFIVFQELEKPRKYRHRMMPEVAPAGRA